LLTKKEKGSEKERKDYCYFSFPFSSGKISAIYYGIYSTIEARGSLISTYLKEL